MSKPAAQHGQQQDHPSNQKSFFTHLQQANLLSKESQLGALKDDKLFEEIGAKCDADTYRKLLSIASDYYEIGICHYPAFSNHQFDSPFWHNWQKRNRSCLLWQQDQQIYIGIYSPSQQIDEKPIHFKFQYKCITVLLHDQQGLRHYLKAQHSKIQTDLTVIEAVESLLNSAIRQNASDIHLEPYEHHARIRFRCDGVLTEHSIIDHSRLNNMRSRLKVLSNMDIAEKRLPQDGRMLFDSQDHGQRDFRLSTMPTLFGEKMVLRILSQQQQTMHLSELGLSHSQLTLITKALQQQNGMILTTGPTGSGKTNTLYSLTAALNLDDVNIVSVEDPVEIYLSGINQINTNYKAGLTFASALKGILRQDPDIVMLGEIRDTETADIAVKAAQTGHLVLSSLHTNDAIGSVTRLLDMGLAAYRLSAALHILIAQRLIRQLCQNCKQALPYDEEIWRRYALNRNDTLFTPLGCAACHNGYAGRTGIFEIVALNASLFQAIIKNDQDSIAKELANQKFISLRSSAIKKLKQGISSIQEIERVL